MKGSVIAGIDPIIRVDFSKSLVLPVYITHLADPKLEVTGPTEYDVTTVESLLTLQGGKGLVAGEVIHQYLTKRELLPSCLSRYDLWAVRQRGGGFFRNYYEGKTVSAWRSLGWDSLARCWSVPCNVPFGQGVMEQWRLIRGNWSAADIIAGFKSAQA